MADPWTFTGSSPTTGGAGGAVTLVEGSAFAISDGGGDMASDAAQGLFFRDTRFCSGLVLRINGSRPEPLASEPSGPFAATFVLRAAPRAGRADSSLLVLRYRWVGRGMREDIVIRNYGEEPAFCALELAAEADFANLFAVKEGRTGGGDRPDPAVVGSSLIFGSTQGVGTKGLRVAFAEPARALAGVIHAQVVIAPGESWSTCLQLSPIIDGEEIEPRYRCGQPVAEATPQLRMEAWRAAVPSVSTDYRPLRAVVARSAEDLGALRIFDPDHPERAVVAAGAPWFMTLFGRDSLLTAWMALLVDQNLAEGVIQTLARFQGEASDAATEEAPGKILHEMRFGEAPSLSLGGGSRYYGSADATPLFVMLLGELRRWGLASEVVERLLPAADRAMEWICGPGDADGDGYVEYRRSSDRGLANQGWKDSWDGIRFANGQLARPPIALAEVQGYTYGAYLARAHFADEAGDAPLAAHWRHRAADLRTAFNRDFWLDDKGWFALGLDGDKKPIDALASNMGHCLWTGIVDVDKAAAVADRLMSPEMWTGWGIRTLATSMEGYNPLSYHVGSVWPHDNALIAAGLMRYGFVDAAHQVIRGLLEAAARFDHRLPELFGGLGRDEVPFCVPYPSSCSPQAWSAASPLLFLRTLLRLEPWVPHGKVWLAPALPEWMTHLRVEGIPLAGHRVTVEVRGDQVDIEGLPDEIEVVTTPRHPLPA
ncbi:MAG: amylo-alpha-1,6-glucosidase [Acidimicrobiales bacterium]